MTVTTKHIKANGINLAYEEFGNPDHPAILLIMGLATQLTAWPLSLCEDLVARNYRVIRFDNRDIGLSQKMEGAKVIHPLRMFIRARMNLPISVPYKLPDMAADAVGLLDALNIERAHIVGVSMGGMIAQIIAGQYPERVLSLTSIMSTSGRRTLPGPDFKVSLHLARRPMKGSAKEVQEYSMDTYRLIGSPGYPPVNEELRAKVVASYERSFYPQGSRRQMAAIMASGDRIEVLKKITAPTLVIHGKADPLVPVSGGIDTALHIEGSRLELIEGMGHDLPEALMPRMASLIGEHAAGI